MVYSGQTRLGAREIHAETVLLPKIVWFCRTCFTELAKSHCQNYGISCLINILNAAISTRIMTETLLDLSTIGSSDITPNNELRKRGLRTAAYLILERGGPNDCDEILMLRRANTGYMDGMYSFVAGHVEMGESVTQALVREAQEEAGITVALSDLRFAHTCHRRSQSDLIYHDFFFRTSRWTGDVMNMEPDRCSDLCWFSRNSLPENTIPYIREVIEMIYLRSQSFSEYNWITQ